MFTLNELSFYYKAKHDNIPKIGKHDKYTIREDMFYRTNPLSVLSVSILGSQM